MNHKKEFPSIINKLKIYDKLTGDQKLELAYQIKIDWITEKKINIARADIRKSLIKGYKKMLESAA